MGLALILPAWGAGAQQRCYFGECSGPGGRMPESPAAPQAAPQQRPLVPQAAVPAPTGPTPAAAVQPAARPPQYGPGLVELQQAIARGPNAVSTQYSFLEDCTLEAVAAEGEVRNVVRFERAREGGVRLEQDNPGGAEEVWRVRVEGSGIATRFWRGGSGGQAADAWLFYVFTPQNKGGTTAPGRAEAAVAFRDAVAALVRRCARAMGDR